MYGSGGGLITGGGVAGGTLAYTGADPHVAIVTAIALVGLGALLAARKQLLHRKYRTHTTSH